MKFSLLALSTLVPSALAFGGMHGDGGDMNDHENDDPECLRHCLEVDPEECSQIQSVVSCVQGAKPSCDAGEYDDFMDHFNAMAGIATLCLCDGDADACYLVHDESEEDGLPPCMTVSELGNACSFEPGFATPECNFDEFFLCHSCSPDFFSAFWPMMGTEEMCYQAWNNGGGVRRTGEQQTPAAEKVKELRQSWNALW
jgi:hypothetical protein